MTLPTHLPRKLRFHAANLIYFARHRRKLRIGLRDFIHLKRQGFRKESAKQVRLSGRPFEFSSSFWFLHSLDEIFVQEVYRFQSRNDAPVIVDCGANVGLSVLYFKTLFPDAKVTAFEADAEIFETLRRNLAEHRSAGVHLHNAAVWTANGHLGFTADGALGGRVMESGGNSNTVESIRLKDLLQHRVDFLKIDIEGAEYAVLKDCRDELRNVENLFVEYHSKPADAQTLDEILGILRSAGFRYYIQQAWPTMTHPYVQNGSSFVYDLQLNVFAYRPSNHGRPD
jgi:FkbM family methyltransferase